MGRDATLYIPRGNTKKSIEDFIKLLGYKKFGDTFYYGNDNEYRHLSGVSIWVYNAETEDYSFSIWVRTQIYASGYDIKFQNNTLRMLKKHYNAYFISDKGKNRYFDVNIPLKQGAENGCYLAAVNLYHQFFALKIALSKFPKDLEGEKIMLSHGIPSPNVFNANVYLSYLCSIIEDFFRNTYISLLRFSDKKDKIMNTKLSSFDLSDISQGNISVEEAYARTLSFQNIQKINSSFITLDSKLDISSVLKKPYKKRKVNLYDRLNLILEHRHSIIHRLQLDLDYDSESIQKDIDDIKVSIIKVYEFICSKYDWEIENVMI